MKNKEKYSLDKLKISVSYAIVGIGDIKIYHGIKRVYYKSYDVEEFALRWITDFIKWLEEDDGKECKPTILTDEEKAYLSAVIKPFRNEVECIVKYMFSEEKEFLAICLHNGEEITLPIFIRRTMYKGMKSRKEYTLKELGL